MSSIGVDFVTTPIVAVPADQTGYVLLRLHDSGVQSSQAIDKLDKAGGHSTIIM